MRQATFEQVDRAMRKWSRTVWSETTIRSVVDLYNGGQLAITEDSQVRLLLQLIDAEIGPRIKRNLPEWW